MGWAVAGNRTVARGGSRDGVGLRGFFEERLAWKSKAKPSSLPGRRAGWAPPWPGVWPGAGARLALCDLNKASLDNTAGQCREAGAEVHCYGANVAKEADVVAFMDAVVSDCGALDALINNAGITRDGLLMKFKNGGIARQDVTGRLAGSHRCEPYRHLPLHPRGGGPHGALGCGGRDHQHLQPLASGQLRPVELLGHQGRRCRAHRALGAGTGAPRHSHRGHRTRSDEHRNGGGNETRGARTSRSHGAGENAWANRTRWRKPRNSFWRTITFRAESSTSTEACAGRPCILRGFRARCA